MTTTFADACVELERIRGGAGAHRSGAHGGLESIEPRDYILTMLIVRRCGIAVLFDRERAGQIWIVYLENGKQVDKVTVSTCIFLRMFGTHLLQERVDKLVFLSQLCEEILALTKCRNKHSSSSEEVAEGEDARERSLCSMWDRDKASNFPEAVKHPHKKWTPLREMRQRG